MDIIRQLIQLFTLAMIAWIVLSYIVAFGRVAYDHPVRRVYEFLSKIIDPVLKPIRAVIPPVRVGGTALDLSPLILILGLQLIGNLLG